MSSLTKCTACNYTRKPTDSAPDWACPKCQKAYLKTASLKAATCKNHTYEKATWRCKNCGNEFCNACVKHARQLKPRIIKSIPIAVCPECRGECFDFEYADKLESENIAVSKSSRQQFIAALVVAIAIILAFPFSYYLGKHAGAEDAKHELPKPKWHILQLYGPPEAPPENNMTIVTHTARRRRFSMYIQGYVAGHNEVVKEYILKKKQER